VLLFGFQRTNLFFAMSTFQIYETFQPTRDGVGIIGSLSELKVATSRNF